MVTLDMCKGSATGGNEWFWDHEANGTVVLDLYKGSATGGNSWILDREATRAATTDLWRQRNCTGDNWISVCASTGVMTVGSTKAVQLNLHLRVDWSNGKAEKSNEDDWRLDWKRDQRRRGLAGKEAMMLFVWMKKDEKLVICQKENIVENGN